LTPKYRNVADLIKTRTFFNPFLMKSRKWY